MKRPRPIVLLALFYAAGLSAGQVFRIPPTVLLVAIGAIALSQIVLISRRRTVDVLLWAAIFLFGHWRQNQIEQQNQTARDLAATLEGQPIVRVEGRLAATDRVYPDLITFRVADCRIHCDDGSVADFPTAVQLACRGETYEKVRSSPPLPGVLFS